MSAQAEEIREAVRRFAREQLVPHAAQWDRDKTFPKEALKGLADMGLYGVAIPEDSGGAGLDYTSLAVACEEIAALADLYRLALRPEYADARWHVPTPAAQRLSQGKLPPV